MTRNRKKKKKYTITEHGPSGRLCFPAMSQYDISSWCPTPDGSGTPTKVIVSMLFQQPVVLGFIDVSGKAVHGETDRIGMRFGSRSAINTFIEILEKHRDEVFPL